MTDPKYYFYTEQMLIDGRLKNEVHLIGDKRGLDCYNRWIKVNREIYTNIDLQISEESIKKYNDIKYEYSTAWRLNQEWFKNGLLIGGSLESGRAYLTSMAQQIKEIENNWSKKVDAFLAWKRRRQLVTMWEKNCINTYPFVEK